MESHVSLLNWETVTIFVSYFISKSYMRGLVVYLYILYTMYDFIDTIKSNSKW